MTHFLFFLCLCLFTWFTSFDNFKTTFIYWRESINENRQTRYTFLTEEILWRLPVNPYIINPRSSKVLQDKTLSFSLSLWWFCHIIDLIFFYFTYSNKKTWWWRGVRKCVVLFCFSEDFMLVICSICQLWYTVNNHSPCKDYWTARSKFLHIIFPPQNGILCEK